MMNGLLTAGDFVGFLMYMESLWWGVSVSKHPLPAFFVILKMLKSRKLSK